MKSFPKIIRGALKKVLRRPTPPIEVERAEQIFYLNFLQPGMTVFDVGANIGELTLLFSRFVGDGKVHAFEATRSGFAQLAAVCEAARRANVVLNQAAVTDKDGTAPFYVYDEEHLSWSSLTARPFEEYGIVVAPPQVENVEGVTLDTYCERHNIKTIDLLKIDVEGAEYQVLRGAQRLLASKRIRCLTFEFGQTTFDMGNRPEDIERLLSKQGYRIQNIRKGDRIFPGRKSAKSAQFSVHVATPK